MDKTKNEAPEAEFTLVLSKPIVSGDGGKWTQMFLKEPTLGQWMKAEVKSGLESDVVLLSAVSEIPIDGIKQLSVRDYMRAKEYLNSFFLSALPTNDD